MENIETFSDPVIYNIAVGTAVTFEAPVVALANQYPHANNVLADPNVYETFKYIVTSYQSNKYNAHFEKLTSWHFRYIAGSWSTISELEWLRETVTDNDLLKIGNVKYIEYTAEDSRGISIHDPEKFYDGKPVTLQLLKSYGGVCGGVSKFASSACQCYGVPALPIAQPGHCAHLWLKMDGSNRKWIVGNNVGGLGGGSKHNGISFVWGDITNRAWTIFIMENALKNSEDFILSELYNYHAQKLNQCQELKMTELMLYVKSISACRWNLRSWVCFLNIAKELDYNIRMDDIVQCANRTTNPTALRNETLLTVFGVETCKVVCKEKCYLDAKTACQKRIGNLFDGTESEWWCPSDEATIEIG